MTAYSDDNKNTNAAEKTRSEQRKARALVAFRLTDDVRAVLAALAENSGFRSTNVLARAVVVQALSGPRIAETQVVALRQVLTGLRRNCFDLMDVQTESERNCVIAEMIRNIDKGLT